MTDLPVTPSWTIPSTALRIHFARGGGPGGQNVNKLNTKAELRVGVSALAFPHPDVERRFRDRQASRITSEDEILLVSQVHRSQSMNLDDCRARLVALLRAALVQPRVRRATRPTRGSKERRIEAKRHEARHRRDRRIEE